MASVVIVLSLLTYVSIKKVREHKAEKRALRKYELGVVEVISPSDGGREQSPFCQQGRLGSHPDDEEQTAMKSDKRSRRHFKMPNF
jgi:hypothetical protein